MDANTADRYLERLGTRRPSRIDAGALADLTERHLLKVPFENLSIHLNEPIALTEEALVEKIVGLRRGGFCYELNGAFALLLAELGYHVELAAARVHSPAGLGPPLDHAAIVVRLEGPWLVDVGFGRFARRPVRLDVPDPQPDVEGAVQVTEEVDGDLTISLGGEPQYRLEMRPRSLSDFAPTCWWQQTWPDSHFRQSLTCSLATPRGRVTLSDHLLIATDLSGAREETTLTSDEQVLATYRQTFGMTLDRIPTPPSSRPPIDRDAQELQ